MRIAVCTTFPLSYWDLCAQEMIESFCAHWPEEVDLFIEFDNLEKDQYDATQAVLNDIIPEGRQFFLGNVWEQDQVDFINKHRHKESKDNFRFQAVRFSHKIFALHKAILHTEQEGYDYCIWLDADVITKSAVSLDDLRLLLPDTDQICSYLGRKDAPYSECGWVAYNLKNQGKELISKIHEYYVTDKIFDLPGWTDCDVFDAVRKTYDQKLFKNLSEGVPYTHVWPESKLGPFMQHRKGIRKETKTDEKYEEKLGAELRKKKEFAKSDGAIGTGDLKVKTRNCVENAVIQQQVRDNIYNIKDWVPLCQFNDEPIVIASAGPSLRPEPLREWQAKGVKIVAVKHAIDRLLEWGIKPWACILLDPRPHVESFVKKAPKDVLFFVSSMVHPSVVKSLHENDCQIFGYHAVVNAGETAFMRKGDYTVCGGSATATRGIGLLYESLGFKEFHLYGYDLCHYQKPDLKVMGEDGNPKYYEVALKSATWGNKFEHRTFWTEGQLLAQANELFDLYKTRQPFKITIYGDGLAGWQYRHWMLYQAWMEDYKENMSKKRQYSLNVNDWVNAVTGTDKFSRNS